MFKQDIRWSMKEKQCVIRNVPYQIISDEKVLDLHVSLKVTTLRDLMWDDEIPFDVNYEDYNDIEL